jgi:subfamily B ATP-binding cassette protein MsbA
VVSVLPFESNSRISMNMLKLRQKSWRRLREMIVPYRKRLLISLGTLLVLAGLGIYAPVWTARLIGKALPELNRTLFFECVAALFILNVAINAASYLYSYQMRLVAGRLVFDLRRRLYEHLQRLSLGFYEQTNPGEIISRMMNDVNSITTLITGTALNTIVSLLKAVFLLGVIFATSVKVGFIALIVLPVHFIWYHLFKARITNLTWKSSEKTSQVYGKISEVFGAIKMVKSHAGDLRESRALVAQLREGHDITINSGNLLNVWGQASGTISYAGHILVVLVTGLAVLDEGLPLETFILLMTYVGMLYAPISELISVAQQIVPAKVGMQRVFEIMDMQPEVADRRDGVRDLARGEVVFKDVCFAYERGDQVIKNISFAAVPGEMVALVGPSGSGKSTVANLIARFYDRTSGEILVDGRDIQDYSLRALQNNMSIVLQETHLFRGTIADNICYGKPEATMAEIEAAARLANAHEFICVLPDGYRSHIGSNGVRLSGGQRQRIAIARALIRNPRILILDEATSAMDTVSESQVQEALKHLMEGRTTFVIAHRLSTIKSAQKIIVLREGRVEQIGTHDELIGKEGMYRELYDPDWAREQKRLKDERIEQLCLAA